MTFNQILFNNILNKIEKSLSFAQEDITTSAGWSLKLNLKVQDIFDEFPNDDKDEIKYILEVLNLMKYISFSQRDNDVIDGVTDKGLKFIFLYLHSIDFKFS